MKKKVLGLILLVAGLSFAAQAEDVFRVSNPTLLNASGAFTNAAGANTIPGAGDVAVWDKSLTVANSSIALAADGSWQGIRFGSGMVRGVTIATNGVTQTTLTLGSSGIDLASSPYNLIINPNVVLGSAQTWALAPSGSTTTNAMTVNGVVSGGVGRALTKTGAGILTLNGANTYQGGTTINAGSITAGSATALGTGMVTNKTAIGLALALGTDTTIEGFVSSGGTSLGGTISSLGSTLRTLTIGAGGLVQNADAGGYLDIGNDSNRGTSLKLGASQTWSNNNSAANKAIRLRAGSAASGFSTLALGTNQLTLAGVGNFSMLSGIIGTGGIANNSSGTTTLSGSNTYSGGTTINAGTLTLGSQAAAVNPGAVTVAGGVYDLNALTTVTNGAISMSSGSIINGTLEGTSYTFSGGTASAALAGTAALINSSGTTTLSGTNTYSGGTTISSGKLIVGAGGTSGSLGAGNVLNNGAIVFNRSDVFTNSSVISGSGSVTFAGTGQLKLSAANTFSGGTVVSNVGGNIIVGDVNALGTGTFTFNGGTMSSGANLKTGNGGLGVTNDIVLLKNASWNVLSQDTTLSGKISGTNAFALNGYAMETRLNGDNSAFSGGFNIAGANTLIAGNANAFGTGALTLNTGGKQNNRLQTTEALTIANNINLGASSTNTLTVSLTTNLTLSGVVSGSSMVVKSGASVLTLTGANTYTNTTAVSAGKLVVDGSLDSALITVGSGATLGGTGTVQAVTIAAGGILAAGNSPGTMTFDGALLLSTGSTNVMEIASESVYDVLNGNGNNLTLNGETVFDFSLFSGVTNGTTFALNNLFANWNVVNTNGATYSAIGLGAQQDISIDGGILTVIPEPATIGMLGLGAIITMMIRRMRTR
jgi:autotransporter-associated beta strand protein